MKPMSDDRWYTYVAATISLVLIVGLGVGLGLASSGSSGPTNSSPSQASAAAVDYLNLTIGWNPSSGLDEYFPANITVPSHTLVEITITSYDNGTNVVNAPYSDVRGTAGGSEWITSGGVSREVHGLPASGISHTFTITSMGKMMGGGMSMGSGPVLNIVVPPAVSTGQPVAVTFGAYFNATGAFIWNCMAPCDTSAMMDSGLMTGMVRVV